MEASQTNTIEALASETVVGNQDSPTEKTARFYQTCISVVVDGRDQRAGYREAFQQAGVYWPDFGPKDSDAYVVAAKVYASFLYSSMLDIRRVESFTGEVYLSMKPAQAINVWKRNWDRFQNNDGAYRDYYENSCAAYASRVIGTVDFDTFVDIEIEMFHKLLLQEHFEEVVVLGNLSQLGDIMRPASAKKLTAFVADTYNLTVLTPVHVKGLRYMRNFAKLVEELGHEKVIFYLGWLILQVLWRGLDKHMNALWYKQFGVRASALNSKPQEVDCLEQTENLLGWALFYRFTRDSSGQSTERMSVMAKRLGRAFKRVVAYNKWLVNISLTEKNFTELLFYRKLLSEDKLRQRLGNIKEMTDSAVANWLAVAETRRTLSEDDWDDMRTFYIRDIRTTGKYSVYNKERHDLRAAPLFGELPLFGEGLTDAANYGALGMLIGAAAVELIVHAVPGHRKSVFDKHVSCYFDNSETPPNFARDHFYRSVAVDIVYQVFKAAASDAAKGQDLKDFDRDQTFFQMMCYLLCEGHAKEIPEAELNCNQGVKDSRIFGTVFGCPRGSPMNPRHKCRL
ncbi:hypothetical protein HPB52_022501 [Rhipicephalus sanguineus]|uniref:Endothelin-converting enzyme n=1 Tax=Rhipicephalus sanguineus TaxID=34632 RepID=A0A9D4SPT2_RHISA|nr:hypothetical protein HPB52_022501 [Rhipicephalus sanguineus]